MPTALIILIATLAHEINRAYCQALGDDSQVPWNEAPEWQRESAMKGVHLHINNPAAGPDESHKAWMEEKLAAGWTYGKVKDAEAKTHPCLVPFNKLPKAQQAKDHLFRAAVHQALILLTSTTSEVNGLKERIAELEAATGSTSAGPGVVLGESALEAAKRLHANLVNLTAVAQERTDHAAVARDKMAAVVEILSAREASGLA